MKLGKDVIHEVKSGNNFFKNEVLHGRRVHAANNRRVEEEIFALKGDAKKVENINLDKTKVH